MHQVHACPTFLLCNRHGGIPIHKAYLNHTHQVHLCSTFLLCNRHGGIPVPKASPNHMHQVHLCWSVLPQRLKFSCIFSMQKTCISWNKRDIEFSQKGYHKSSRLEEVRSLAGARVQLFLARGVAINFPGEGHLQRVVSRNCLCVYLTSDWCLLLVCMLF